MEKPQGSPCMIAWAARGPLWRWLTRLSARSARISASNGYFSGTDLTKLKMHLVNQICEASGGPCTYTGRTMKQTHKGMGVTDAAFGALVDDLVSALDQHKVRQGRER